MSKYYKRETVVYKFKHDMLTKGEYRDANDGQRLILWEIFKLTLYQLKKISKHQLETWTYPTKELKSLKTK